MKATEQYFPVSGNSSFRLRLEQLLRIFDLNKRTLTHEPIVNLSGLSLTSCVTLLLTHIRYNVLFVVDLCPFFLVALFIML